MEREILKSKIHRATVTSVDIQYEGSITVDERLLQAAKLYPYEKVDVYNINNGHRFSTYVLPGGPGELCLNGAAGRLAAPGDLVIIVSYVRLTESELPEHLPIILQVDRHNEVTETPLAYQA